MIREDIRRTILELSKLGEKHYGISTQGRRINFETQQIKAISLVDALHQEGHVKTGDRIAVIGGGLSGVTVSARLLRKGCKVDLFEKEHCYFSVQKDASHRFIHPNVNFWPEEPMQFTTVLPLLNWHADACSRVVKQISSEWDAIRAKAAETFNGRLETTYVAHKLKNGKISVYSKKTGSKNVPSADEEPFDLLIDCQGFDVERKLLNKDSPGYWQFRNSSGRQLVVFGSGDGGLVDAIMHIYDIGMEQMVGLVEKLEELLDGMQSTRGREAFDWKVAAAKDPVKIFESMDEQEKKDLRKFLVPQKKVTIVTRSADVFKQKTAALHRILIAYAQNDSYATILTNSTLRKSKKQKSENSGEYVVCDLEKNMVLFDVDDVEVVERLGPEKKTAELLDKSDVWADYARKMLWEEAELELGREFVFRKAVDAIYRLIDQRGPSYHLESLKPWRLIVQNCKDHFAIVAEPEIGFLPNKLFGVEVKINPKIDVATIPYG